MNPKVKQFYDELLIDEQEDDSDGKFGHYPFQARLTSEDGKTTMMAFVGVNTEIMMSVFADRIVENTNEVLLSIDFPNCGDIRKDFIGVFSYINKKIEINLFTYDNTTGKKLEHVKESILYENFAIMVSQFISKSISNKHKKE